MRQAKRNHQDTYSIPDETWDDEVTTDKNYYVGMPDSNSRHERNKGVAK